MDLSSAPDDPADKPATVSKADEPARLPTSAGHAWFTLAGFSFVIFEVIFLCFYGSDFWFDSDVSPLGIPAVAAALLAGHLFLSFAESGAGCHFFAPIWKGRPPFVYRRWLEADGDGFTFGRRRVLYSAIDSLSLTLLGNVQVFSSAICGPGRADMVLKFPLGPASTANQKDFLNRVRNASPAVPFNARLVKRLSAPELKGAAAVQCLGAVFMLLILLDVGQSTFSYLQMMKEYYLAQSLAREGKRSEAASHFNQAESIRAHPFPVSWVSAKLLKEGVVAAGVEQAKAEALFTMGRQAEAIECARRAAALAPTQFRHNLRLARYLAANGRLADARAQIRQAIDNHEDSLLPRLYMIATVAGAGDRTRAAKFYDMYVEQMRDIVFGQEPLWPPGGNRYLHELIYQDDLLYIFDRLLGRDRPRVTADSESEPATSAGSPSF